MPDLPSRRCVEVWEGTMVDRVLVPGLGEFLLTAPLQTNGTALLTLGENDSQ
jgi:hypothetical protein